MTYKMSNSDTQRSRNYQKEIKVSTRDTWNLTKLIIIQNQILQIWKMD